MSWRVVFVVIIDLGLELSHGSCSGPHHVDATVISQPEGYLSSRSVYHSGRGSKHCPWVIVVQPGKTIDLYVIDFSLASRYHDLMTSVSDDAAKLLATGDSNHDGDYCHVYATVREVPGQGQVQGHVEGQGGEEVKICAGNRRKQRVYTSVSNSVTLELSPIVFDDQTVNFLLKYVGTPSVLYSCFTVSLWRLLFPRHRIS